MVGVFIEQATPFLDEFFFKLSQLAYPKNMIHLLIHNAVEYHTKTVADFTEKHGKQYMEFNLIDNDDSFPEWKARNFAL